MSRISVLFMVAAIAASVVSGTLFSGSQLCVTIASTTPLKFNLNDMNSTACSTGNAAAWGNYSATLEKTGWDTLEIEGNGTMNSFIVASAIGFFEGATTWQRNLDWFQNVLSANGSMAMAPGTDAYLQENIAYMDALVAGPGNTTDPYLVNVNLVWRQFRGLASGMDYRNSGLSTSLIFALSAAGDLLDIANVVNPPSSNPIHLPHKRFNSWWVQHSRCSALVKVTPRLDNIFFGHATWANFNMMIRVFKNIRPNYNAPGAVANTITFSSWPGAISSVDDFYVLDSGFGVMETTLNVYNYTLYDMCNPQQMMSCVRSSIANRMARNGSHWAEVFGRHNSGTYNCEWLVLDMNLFTPGQDLLPGTLTIVDQMPGIIRTGDVTEVLMRGYFPSYNVPYFKDVFDAAGYPSAIAQQGPQMLSYQSCVRSQMFESYQNTVVDIPTMTYMMQYNQYTVDPLELGNPTYAIAARGDLLFPTELFGALDAKMTSYADLKANSSIYAFAGPTPQQKVFAWADHPVASALTNHVGMPASWNFTWQIFHPLN